MYGRQVENAHEHSRSGNDDRPVEQRTRNDPNCSGKKYPKGRCLQSAMAKAAVTTLLDGRSYELK
jgi:hypothetical protein